MIELIIVLFKQVLQIPEDRDKNQQRRLLLVFAEESVLDSFIYLTQDFSQPYIKKLTITFLEIQY
jgi:hypothetical protein